MEAEKGKSVPVITKLKKAQLMDRLLGGDGLPEDQREFWSRKVGSACLHKIPTGFRELVAGEFPINSPQINKK